MIEGVRIRGVRLEHLEADQRAIRLAHGNLPDPAILKIDDVVELGLDADRCVEHGVTPRFDDRVQHAHEPCRIRGLDVADGNFHRLSCAGRRIQLDRA